MIISRDNTPIGWPGSCLLLWKEQTHRLDCLGGWAFTKRKEFCQGGVAQLQTLIHFIVHLGPPGVVQCTTWEAIHRGSWFYNLNKEERKLGSPNSRHPLLYLITKLIICNFKKGLFKEKTIYDKVLAGLLASWNKIWHKIQIYSRYVNTFVLIYPGNNT